MLYFHKNNDELGTKIADALANMSAAFKTVENENKTSYLVEDEKLIEGEKAVLAFLADYGKLLTSHQMVTGDSCYLDPETGLSCEI